MQRSSSVMPEYGSNSIVDFSAALLKHYGAMPPGISMDLSAKGIDLEGVDKIVVFLIDAMGYENILPLTRKRNSPLTEETSLSRMSSVFPSTTTAALTSFYTATVPAVHGMLGYYLFLKEFGCISNMIELTPIFQERDSLTRMGMDPLKFLPVPTIFEILHDNGIRGYHITSKSFINTGLTRMHTKGGIAKGVHGIGDMLEEVKNLLHSGAKKSLTVVYWGLVDTFGHKYGPGSMAYIDEIRWLLEAISSLFSRLRSSRIAFFVTADHGQIATPWEKEVWINKHDDMYGLLYTLPAGEHRALYLYTKQEERLRDMLSEHYSDKAMIMSREEAIEAFLFGGVPEESLLSRIGELILIPKQDEAFCFRYSGQEHSMKGRHGGLTNEEMNIPLIFMRR